MSDFNVDLFPVPSVSMGDSVPKLYENLELLRRWVNLEADAIQQCIPLSGEPPCAEKNEMPLSRFISYIPLQVHYGTFRSIDELRDRYDFLFLEES